MKYTVGILIGLVIILTGAVGYLYGKSGFNSSSNPLPSSSSLFSPSPSTDDNNVACTLEAKLCADGSSVGRVPPSCDFAPCPEPSLIVVKGGGILSFPKYEISIPKSWSHSRESNTKDDEKITLTDGMSTISIQQGGFGGAMCLYPGDADSEGPAGRYKSYTELTTKSGDKLRRSVPESGGGFGICQLTQYGWGSPTLYGHISLKLNSTNEEDLETVDTILKSITKI